MPRAGGRKMKKRGGWRGNGRGRRGKTAGPRRVGPGEVGAGSREGVCMAGPGRGEVWQMSERKVRQQGLGFEGEERRVEPRVHRLVHIAEGPAGADIGGLDWVTSLVWGSSIVQYGSTPEIRGT